MKFDQGLWEQATAFHGHECPGLAIGYRAALAAMERLGVTRSGDEELVAIVETDACGVDAIQFLTGCSLGKGNLLYKNHGKQAFTIANRSTGKAVRVYVDSSKLPVENDDRQAKMQAILTAPEEVFCKIEFKEIQLPEKARIFQSHTCTSCGEKMAESRARLKNGQVVCLACFDNYERGW
ncbi:MAG: FmdE family protein [Desulfitobacteriaceae bacterium]|nr:FmdE family protein [Desulfitobacteriaceae bacterium]